MAATSVYDVLARKSDYDIRPARAVDRVVAARPDDRCGVSSAFGRRLGIGWRNENDGQQRAHEEPAGVFRVVRAQSDRLIPAPPGNRERFNRLRASESTQTASLWHARPLGTTVTRSPGDLPRPVGGGDLPKKLLWVLSLIAAGAVGASLAFVLPSSAAGGTKHKEFTYFEKSTKDHSYQADQGQGGFSEGDYEVGHEPLFKNHHKVASITRVCHDIRVNRAARSATVQCEGVLKLKGGTLTLLTRITFGNSARKDHIAITGGTGIYRDASGVITVDFNTHPAPFHFSIDY